MVNSLANHGFLPRNGLNVSKQQIVDGFEQGINLEPASSGPVVDIALAASTTGYNDTLNLDDLSKHGGEQSLKPNDEAALPRYLGRSHER